MILDACSRNGVAQLKLGAFEVSFGGPITSFEHALAPGPINPATSPENVIQAQTTEEQIAHEEQEIATKEQQIAELMITNPALAEKLMEDGDLLPPAQGDVEDDGISD